MRRLTYVVIFTERFEEMRAFYGRQIGLAPASAGGDDWMAYDTGGARIALHRATERRKPGMLLRFESEDLDADVASLAARGIEFQGAPRDYPWGRMAEFDDPEGNGVGVQHSRDPHDGHGVEVDRVVLSCEHFAETTRWYREKLGLAPTVESDHWAEFDTGDTHLALHPRRDVEHPPHTEQQVTVVLGSSDLMEWVEGMRERDVHFATAPIEEDFGLYAEATDPDGYVVVFREPSPPMSLEEELAAAFEEDDAPHQVAIRKPPQKPSRASGLIAGLQRRSRREAEAQRRERAAAQAEESVARKLDVVAPRGTGAAGARQKPKTLTDPKRAKAKPAIGSLKAAGREATAAKQRSVARRSKTAPLKGAAPRPAKATAKRTPARVTKAAPKKVARAAPKRATKAAPKRAAKAAPKRAAKAAPKRGTKAAPKRAAKRAARATPKRAAKSAGRRR